MTDMFVDAIASAVAAKIQERPAQGSRRLLTLEQAAEYLGCHPNSVKNLVTAGVIKEFHWPMERLRSKPYFDLVDLDQRIEQIKKAA